MADLYGLEASGLPPELVAQLGSIQGQKKIAEAMLRSGMSPVQVQRGAMSPTQGIAKILEAYLGRKGIEKADKGQADIAQRKQALYEAEMGDYNKARMGAPAQAPMIANDDEGNQMPMVSATPADPRDLIAKALQANNPLVRQLGQLDFQTSQADVVRADTQKFRAEESKAARAFREQEAAASRDARMAELQMRLESQATSAADRNAIMLEIARMRGDAQKLGLELKGAAAKSKEDEKREKKAQGMEAVTDLVSTMRGYYDDLNKARAITSTGRGTIGNISAAIATSAPGQIAGRVMGTKEQSLRDSVAQSRPLLLNAIREATGMSAKALDSNAELQLFLRSATDPEVGYEANLRALENIEKFITKKGGSEAAAPKSNVRVVDW